MKTKKYPRTRIIEEFEGDLGREAQRRLVEALTEGDEEVAAAILSRVAFMRQELTPPDASPALLLLVERLCGDWLALHDAEMRHVRTQTHAADNFRRLEAQQRKISECHERYLASIEALVAIRPNR
jgi:hypothetical protein